MAEKKIRTFPSSTLRAVAAQAAREHQQRRAIFAAMALKPAKQQGKPIIKGNKDSAR